MKLIDLIDGKIPQGVETNSFTNESYKEASKKTDEEIKKYLSKNQITSKDLDVYYKTTKKIQ